MSSPKKLSAKELRKLSQEERIKLLEQLRSELVKLETQRGRGIVDNPGRIKTIKRAIARILTIERELRSKG